MKVVMNGPYFHVFLTEYKVNSDDPNSKMHRKFK